MLGQLPDFIPGDAVVTDVGSTKAETVSAAGGLPKRFEFIGGHPLAGAAFGGIAEARSDLFDGQPWLLTPDRSTDADALARLRRFVEGLGASPVELTASDHDRMVAYLSHLPQLAVTALMHVVGESVGEDGLALAGRGLRDTTRLASSPSGIWRDIAATNPKQRRRGHRRVHRRPAAVQVAKSAKPDASFDAIFASAARWKQTLDGSLMPRTSIRTYLEMRAPSDLRPAEAPAVPMRIERVAQLPARILAISLQRSRTAVPLVRSAAVDRRSNP